MQYALACFEAFRCGIPVIQKHDARDIWKFPIITSKRRTCDQLQTLDRFLGQNSWIRPCVTAPQAMFLSQACATHHITWFCLHLVVLFTDELLDEKAPLFQRYRAMFSLRNRGDEKSVLALAQGITPHHEIVPLCLTPPHPHRTQDA